MRPPREAETTTATAVERGSKDQPTDADVVRVRWTGDWEQTDRDSIIAVGYASRGTASSASGRRVDVQRTIGALALHSQDSTGDEE